MTSQVSELRFKSLSGVESQILWIHTSRVAFAPLLDWFLENVNLDVYFAFTFWIRSLDLSLKNPSWLSLRTFKSSNMQSWGRMCSKIEIATLDLEETYAVLIICGICCNLLAAGSGHWDGSAAGGWVSVSWLSVSINIGSFFYDWKMTVLISVKLARLFCDSVAFGHYVF